MIAAFLFAVGSQIQNIGLQTLDSRTGTMLSIGANALLFWLAAPFILEPSYFLHPAVLIFVLVGLVRPALSANLAVAGIKHLGPTLTQTMSATSPLFGAAFGILILDEQLNLQIACGTIGIVLAIILLTMRKKGTPVNWPLWALALPVGAAMIRSVGHGLAKVGMVYIPDPYFVGLVGASVSFVVVNTLWRRNPNRPQISHRDTGVRWFLLSGFFFGSAVLSLNVALYLGTIITVVPIIATSPIFSMLLSIFVFRKEHITLRLVIAVLVVMPSVVLITLGR